MHVAAVDCCKDGAAAQSIHYSVHGEGRESCIVGLEHGE